MLSWGLQEFSQEHAKSLSSWVARGQPSSGLRNEGGKHWECAGAGPVWTWLQVYGSSLGMRIPFERDSWTARLTVVLHRKSPWAFPWADLEKHSDFITVDHLDWSRSSLSPLRGSSKVASYQTWIQTSILTRAAVWTFSTGCHRAKAHLVWKAARVSFQGSRQDAWQLNAMHGTPL